MTLSAIWSRFPRQYWLMFFGMLISTIGASMIWPFQMIFITSRLGLPLATVATLSTINAAAGIVSSFIGGPITDRAGRKWVMVISLAVNGLVYLGMSQATTYWHFALLMLLGGAFNPLYRLAADAMMADLVPPKDRTDGYSIFRMSNNLGLSLGPTIGGFIAASSYNRAFFIGAAGMVIYSVMIAVMARETLPSRDPSSIPVRERFGGYDAVIADRKYISFVGTFTLVTMCASIMWVLLSVYTNQNFGLSERQYGFIPATNAIMVVVLQVLVTQFTKRRHPLWMVSLGGLLYAIGAGSVALGTGFWGFWSAMVIMTFGELILVPVSSTYIANLAPADKRARYMSLYALTWPVANGIGPLMGGLLNDRLGPQYIWVGAGLFGLLGAIGYAIQARHQTRTSTDPQIDPAL